MILIYIAITASWVLGIDAVAIQPALQLLNVTTINSPSNVAAYIRQTYCDAKVYSVPQISSCLDVYEDMSGDDTEVDFGDRNRGIFIYPLPYRMISGDGKCVIDIENLPSAYKDRASIAQMRAAALELLEKCVFGKRAGGITTGLGESKGLAMTINTYDPDVECQQKMSRSLNIKDCEALLQVMPTSTDTQIFGNEGDRGTEVTLPFDLVAPGGKCGFLFVAHGGAQKRNWYDLWQAATAVWGICGRKQEQGFASVGNDVQAIDVAMYLPPESAFLLNSTVDDILRTTP